MISLFSKEVKKSKDKQQSLVIHKSTADLSTIAVLSYPQNGGKDGPVELFCKEDVRYKYV